MTTPKPLTPEAVALLRRLAKLEFFEFKDEPAYFELAGLGLLNLGPHMAGSKLYPVGHLLAQAYERVAELEASTLDEELLLSMGQENDRLRAQLAERDARINSLTEVVIELRRELNHQSYLADKRLEEQGKQGS